MYETPDEFAAAEVARNASWQGAAGGAGANSSSWSASPSGSGSPVPGMSAKDFQKMCQSVDKAFSQFARLVNKGVEEAAEALGHSSEDNLKAHQKLQEQRKAQKKAQKQARKQAQKQARAYAQQQAREAQAQRQAQTAQAQAQRQYQAANFRSPQAPPSAPVPQPAQGYAQAWRPLAPNDGRFRSSWGLTASGVLMTAAGGAGTFLFGISTLTMLATEMVIGPGGIIAAAMCGIVTAGFGTLLGFGIKRLRRASRLKAVRRIVGNREVCNIDELASRMQISPKAALSAVRGLIKGGYLPAGRLDDEGRTLMVTEGAYHQYRQFQQAQRQALADEQAAKAHAAEEAAKSQAPAMGQNAVPASDSLTPAQRAFLERGRASLRQMAELNGRIEDAAVSEKVSALEAVTARILDRAEAEPKVIAGLDRLNDYYLPTTLKLLEAYDALEEQPVQGENIASSRREIEHTLDVLNGAFEKLLDDTFQELNMDVSADISVLHALLAQEGLTDSPFDAKP
ncbi:5-bromo-4-chloroindolyl phosphate hydrolysis family protein [uncultured Adlercreutzia sp.]|uniref:5-bromo-4-chloroindolyl phosphate hydrolysis family protein n=1 Tax=uncultured Adlercreutzia sp. TaxID=875803 RepID=UPI0025F655B4|nr:5-bromo-4-chloroindolyl phosphate hydrolysis family protein [uncultured Adlercreutzia sp.]